MQQKLSSMGIQPDMQNKDIYESSFSIETIIKGHTSLKLETCKENKLNQLPRRREGINKVQRIKTVNQMPV